MIAALMKDNRLSFQKIYRKSQISLYFFEKTAFANEHFLQNLTISHENCEAKFETLGPSVVTWSSKMLANDVYSALGQVRINISNIL
jgi:hypothetical protein